MLLSLIALKAGVFCFWLAFAGGWVEEYVNANNQRTTV